MYQDLTARCVVSFLTICFLPFDYTILEYMLQKVRYLVDHDVDLKYVECGDSHTVTVGKSGECYAWGNSNSGRLGVIAAGGTTTVQDVQEGAGMRHILLPQIIEGLGGIPIQTVACGSAHTLFVTEDQRLYATGCNICGQVIISLAKHNMHTSILDIISIQKN